MLPTVYCLIHVQCTDSLTYVCIVHDLSEKIKRTLGKRDIRTFFLATTDHTPKTSQN